MGTLHGVRGGGTCACVGGGCGGEWRVSGCVGV